MDTFIKPNFLIRYGTWVTSAIIILIFMMSWFIKYPQIVTTDKSKLTGTNAPQPIFAKQTGRIVFLNKKNGSYVKENEIIGCLETTGKLNDIIHFSNFVDSLYILSLKDDSLHIKQIMKLNFTNLGELQADYQTLIQAYLPYSDFVLGEYSDKRKILLKRDISNAYASHELLNEQNKLYKQDLALNQLTLDKNQKLLENKIISEQEYRELVSQNINKKMSEQQMKSAYLSNVAELNGIQKESVELDKEIANQGALFKQVVYNVKSKIDKWKNNYLLVATTNGKLAFTSFLQENQLVQAGKAIMYIIPNNSNIYVESLVPQNNFGKIAPGQKTLLKFAAYPSNEYGNVIGEVDYISPIPSDSGYYLVKVILPNQLKTTYSRKIPYIEGLSVQTEIVTKDMRLAESLYYDVLQQIKK